MILIVLMSTQSCSHNNYSKDIFFKIKVIDNITERGVPMVCFMPLSQQKYYSDSNGFIAFNEPGLMNDTVYFEVKCEGYQYAMGKDGKRAVSLYCKPGDSTIVKITRINVSERLYRSTGLGIYKDSYLLDEDIPIDKPLINGKILGQDSNLASIYKDKIFWIWGDSFLPPEYHGNFSVAAAITEFPKNGGLDPEIGMNYNYIVDEQGASKPMIKLESPGYVWFDWLLNIQGKNGQEQLVAKYASVNSLFQNYERGVALYNDERKIFESVAQIDAWMPFGHRCEHPFKGNSNGKDYVYMTSEFDFKRVSPELDSLLNPISYESFSCLKEGTEFDIDNLELDRDLNGKLVYGWKRNTGFIDVKRQQQMVQSGKIQESEIWTQMTDIETGDIIDPGRGSIYWNKFRKKWVMIGGAKNIWYSEADTPVGPWVYARKVAEHQSFFYNPTQHPFFDKEDGAEIFFEGTFTKFLSQEEIVPYYDYNQIFYKLSLEDEQTFLPSPVYLLNDGLYINATLPKFTTTSDIKGIPFFAMSPNRNIEGMIPVFAESKGRLMLESKNGKPLFYAFPLNKNGTSAYIGTWETKIQFGPFDNSFKMDIHEEDGKLNVVSDKKSFKMSKSRIENGILMVTLTHDTGIYYLEGKQSAGIIKGEWFKKNSYNRGLWECTLKPNDKWWGQYNTSLVPLFEFHNYVTNEYQYSTDPNFYALGFLKNPIPICRVWHNPIQQVILDFDTKPMLIPSIY